MGSAREIAHGWCGCIRRERSVSCTARMQHARAMEAERERAPCQRPNGIALAGKWIVDSVQGYQWTPILARSRSRSRFGRGFQGQPCSALCVRRARPQLAAAASHSPNSNWSAAPMASASLRQTSRAAPSRVASIESGGSQRGARSSPHAISLLVRRWA